VVECLSSRMRQVKLKDKSRDEVSPEFLEGDLFLVLRFIGRNSRGKGLCISGPKKRAL